MEQIGQTIIQSIRGTRPRRSCRKLISIESALKYSFVEGMMYSWLSILQ